ncbi:MAG: SpoIIE family protein phosphatase [Candidatus Eisenbacteria bacterium]|nr:SpoIIE family protein phosphatase [Candidatus Eisenbacteria bacterium]
MEGRMHRFAELLRPDLESLPDDARAVAVGDVLGFAYTVPLALIGIVWLGRVTVPDVALREWPVFLGMLVLVYAFRKLDFQFFVEVKEGTFGGFGGTLERVLVWAAALVFGATALWLVVVWRFASALRQGIRADDTFSRWQVLRELSMSVAEDTLPPLGALALYRLWGGVIPLPGLWLSVVRPAFYATLAKVAFSSILSAPFFVYFARSPVFEFGSQGRRPMLRFWASSSSWPLMVEPFGVLAAGIYIQDGLWASLFLVAGAVLASILAHALSRAVEHAQHRSRELERLESLSRDLIQTHPSASRLVEILERHAVTMFALCQLEIRVFPDQVVVSRQYRDRAVPDEAWEWLAQQKRPRVFGPREDLPWGERRTSAAILMVPITETDGGETIGGVSIRRRQNPERAAEMLPAAQSLAGQIASALEAASLHSRLLEHERVEQELEVAAEIQASFMPRRAPDIPGWQVRAIIDSAREASGDFIDIVPLRQGRWGFLVADVSGKGVPAALYMALTRTLIRTFAFEHPDSPDAVLTAANRRILEDTDDDLFVTVFYGVLDPDKGTFRYANAGHNPPYLLHDSGSKEVTELRGTGVPLGMLKDASWEAGDVSIEPNEAVVLFTDGVTEAQNASEEFFGEERLVRVAVANRDRSALDLRVAIFEAVQEFMGGAPRSDDIAIAVVKREQRTGKAEPS